MKAFGIGALGALMVMAAVSGNVAVAQETDDSSDDGSVEIVMGTTETSPSGVASPSFPGVGLGVDGIPPDESGDFPDSGDFPGQGSGTPPRT